MLRRDLQTIWLLFEVRADLWLGRITYYHRQSAVKRVLRSHPVMGQLTQTRKMTAGSLHDYGSFCCVHRFRVISRHIHAFATRGCSRDNLCVILWIFI
jgi:hypothetical protein